MKKILIILAMLIFILGFLASQLYNNPTENPIKIIHRGKLENLLLNLTSITDIENGDCLSYALYYKEILEESYPRLDVRKIDMAGICPIGTKECGDMEGMPHTYLIVNGYGGECILDQKELACIQIRG